MRTSRGGRGQVLDVQIARSVGQILRPCDDRSCPGCRAGCGASRHGRLGADDLDRRPVVRPRAPVIGLDHLAFVVAAGVIAAYLNSGWRVPATFAAFSIAGVALRFVLPDMQFAEAAVAGTVVMAGLAMAVGRLGPAAAWIAFAALAGLLHGYAFGEAVVGAEATPILWYLFGLAASQLAVSNTVMAVVGMTLTHDATHSWRTRTAGAAIALLGSALLATSVFQV